MRVSRIFYVALLTMALFGLTANAEVIEMRIDDNANDAEEHINLESIHGAPFFQGYALLQSSDTEMGSEGDGGLDWQAVGLQWDQLGIPQGSTINSAKITLQYDDGGNDGDPNLTIFAEDIDDSPTFQGFPPDPTGVVTSAPEQSNITARSRTAGVAWAPPLTTDADIGSLIDTPDLSALVQAIVSRPGWSENNMLTFIVIPDAYLALADITTGGTTAVRESEFEADGAPSTDQAILTIAFTPPQTPPSITKNNGTEEPFATGTAEWTVEFSQSVDNVTGDDFSVVISGDVAADDPTVAVARLSGTSFVVTSANVSGSSGTLALAFNGNDVATTADAIPVDSTGAQGIYTIGIFAAPAAGPFALLLGIVALLLSGVAFVYRRAKWMGVKH